MVKLKAGFLKLDYEKVPLIRRSPSRESKKEKKAAKLIMTDVSAQSSVRRVYINSFFPFPFFTAFFFNRVEGFAEKEEMYLGYSEPAFFMTFVVCWFCFQRSNFTNDVGENYVAIHPVTEFNKKRKL